MSGLASGRGRWGPNAAPTCSASLKLPASAASQPSSAGVESWVRKATSSPLVSAMARLRVRPWPNSSGAIRTSRAPAFLAISGERSVEPESITTTSSVSSTRCANTAASTSSR